MIVKWLTVPAMVALMLVGCAGPSAPASTVNRKCGACHQRPQPGQTTVGSWERVKEEHVERLHMTDQTVRALEQELFGREATPSGASSTGK